VVVAIQAQSALGGVTRVAMEADIVIGMFESGVESTALEVSP